MKRLAVVVLTGLMLASPVMARDATKSGTRREEFKQKLQTVKDERKKKIVERADAKLAEINKRRTDAMTRHLDKMSEILAKVKARGGDTTAAEAAVAEARSAVAAQAAKVYTITITTEDKLKINVGETMKALITDLRNLHEGKIVPARKAVSDAIKSI
ncbi:MAG: hypothetical protein UX99_C0007G0015 [Candidatus Amesbacteria bacterium GW2011_GWB1_47_26]|uniref:OmpH family outer membrane protein n=1 Tax=Candidatus Amesbacteria bacterium GW2011_GWC2_45_19 TaxID=1618366 RepID=A0A0G1M338_9BACT|nr:MAG: hypothetical protein UX05_C0012G0009 [Candidatus Amesbacteria bacterium GW2011_GWC2_45_19]KKU37927.1 MAG: hypothetical protein UX52_C0014G0004 [Candidatus Amesbacteria bacterium GW2011_GWA1_46_35]KKU69041.1 MAG: hypothetical protein UX93_C0003G0033 [Microgenomates group bacterium GW2011_GWC1_47_20]KKU74727.1 MAG: hypothetical protein UX99_C0007G0015 [Candidatus Amesbacteria bacterium GW2011_GWB1_47_26]KKU79768.1 MAG: hypothetical protein UY06_C0014G0009 [Candidatus Amesbacteria bacteriu